MRFKPGKMFNDEIINSYATLCGTQANEFVASTWWYTDFCSYLARKKPLVSAE